MTDHLNSRPPIIRRCWAAVACVAALAAGSARAQELLLAGGDEAFVVDAQGASAAGPATPPAKLWRWSGSDAPDLPEDQRRRFLHLDECKPIDGGKMFLICASNGGCAVVDRASKRILWRADARNAHSLALLPGDRIVAASSNSGDQLLVFDGKRTDPAESAEAPLARPQFATPLPSAHGVVWDAERKRLWALGFDELRAYSLKAWETDRPELNLERTFRLPDDGGHDLSAVPNSSELLLTTGRTVQLFDRDRGTFKPHPTLGAEADVKSVDIHPSTGRVAVSTWKKTVRLFEPAGSITFADASPYKARWLPPASPR